MNNLEPGKQDPSQNNENNISQWINFYATNKALFGYDNKLVTGPSILELIGRSMEFALTQHKIIQAVSAVVERDKLNKTNPKDDVL